MSNSYELFPGRRTIGSVACLLAMAAWATAAGAEEYSKAYTVSGKPTVHVTTNDGGITVTAGDSGKVELRVDYQGYTLDKTLHIDSAQHGDRIELTAQISKLVLAFGQVRRLHIDVRVPRDADLEIESGDGAVKASGVSGAISLHTRDGSISADHLAGTLDLHTGDGGISVNALSGTVRLGTGDGAIEGRDIDGRCEAASRDGGIRLTGRFDVLTIKGSDGSVDARAVSGSKLDAPWSISTGSGSVTVALPSTARANLDASSGDGRVRLDLPVEVEGTMNSAKVRGKINGGGPALTIHTGDGSIHVLAD